MTTQQDKIRGSLIGGAIGDALGYPVEFIPSFRSIQYRYGEPGITRFDTDHTDDYRSSDASDDKAWITDDTQMTLFTACGLLNAQSYEQMPSAITEAYVEWYLSQGNRHDAAYSKCWIKNIPALNVARAPGNTCMSALGAIYRGCESYNQSKGCGGIMRTAPVALYGAIDDRLNIEQSMLLSAQAAKCTHLHPLGWLPSALEAYLLYRLVQNVAPTVDDFRVYLSDGYVALSNLYPDQQEHIDYLKSLTDKALLLVDASTSDVQNIEAIGEGWVGEEALAMAIYCTAKYFDNFEQAMIASVNHKGDSDSIGAITGNLLGAVVGYEALPQCYLEELELRNVILHVADDLWRGQNTLPAPSRPAKPTHQSYQVTDWCWAGEYPGFETDEGARAKLQQFQQFGITHYIDLTEEGELHPYAHLLPQGVQHRRFPIRDVSTPKSTESVRRLIADILQLHAEQPEAICYIHCWGGVGRTGTIVACLLATLLGTDCDDTLQELQRRWSGCPKSRYRDSPETDGQLRFIREYIANHQ